MERKKLYFVCFFILLVISLLCITAQGKELSKIMNAKDIVDKEKKKWFPSNSISNITMTIFNKNDEKRLRKILVKRKDAGDGEAKFVVSVVYPSIVKGTTFLVWEHKNKVNDVFIYLPALDIVKRLAAEQKKSRFIGSDLSYADLEYNVNESNHRIMGEQEIDKKWCWMIESIPKPDSISEYSKQIAWISKETYLPIQTEFFNKKGKLCKFLKVLRIGFVNKELLPLHILVMTISENTKTEIIFEKMELNQDIHDSEFTHQAIKQ